MAKVPRKINHRNKPIPHKGITAITKEMDLQIAVEVREEIIELYQSGYAVEDIAETFNYDPDFVFILLFIAAKNGEVTRSYGRRYKTSC